MYFQLLHHRGRDQEPKEILAFHWHSVDEESEYGNLPHVHVKAAADPLPRSHFGVALTVGSAAQGTIEYLDRLLDEAVAMVDAEVLERLRETPLRWP